MARSVRSDSPPRAASYSYSATKDPERIKRQHERCGEFNDLSGFVRAGTYSDQAVKSASRRPGLGRLIADAAAKRVDIVVVEDLHQLSRRPLRLLLVLQQLAREGCEVRAVYQDGGSLSCASTSAIATLCSAIVMPMKVARERHRGRADIP